MHARRTGARVERRHRVTVELPSDFPDGDVEVIVLPANSDTQEEQTARRPGRLTVDELLASRLSPPAGAGPVSLTDIECSYSTNMCRNPSWFCRLYEDYNVGATPGRHIKQGQHDP